MEGAPILRTRIGLAVRLALVALFGVAAVKKLVDPSRLLLSLSDGLGLSEMLAGFAFVGVFGVLILVCLALVLRPRVGLLAAGIFFLAGAGYAQLLESRSYQGSCGCGVAVVADSANPLRVHTYQNTACAAFCLFLAFRAKPGGVGHDICETP